MSTKLLYIEDDDKQRESLAESLASRGFELTAVSSGKEGLERLSELAPDVVLCDLNMPSMSGIEVLKSVHRENPNVPFVLLTAHPSIPEAVDAIEQGAYRFLIKPLSIDEVEITIRHALEHFRLERWKREADEELTRIVESTPVPFIMSTVKEGRILYANRPLAQLVGTTPEALKGRYTPEFYYDPAERQQVLERLRQDGFVKNMEVRMRRDDGSPIWTLFSLSVTELRGEGVILGGVIDITPRKQAEERLKLYREIFVNSIDPIIVLDPAGCVVERNPSHLEKTGLTDDDVIGRSIYTFLGQEKAEEIQSALADGGSFRGEAAVQGVASEGREAVGRRAIREGACVLAPGSGAQKRRSRRVEDTTGQPQRMRPS